MQAAARGMLAMYGEEARMTVTTGSVARLRRLIDTQRRHERWRDLATALRNLPRAFRLVWNAHPLGLIGLAALSLVAAGMPLAQAWTGKLIVDSVVQATSAGPAGRRRAAGHPAAAAARVRPDRVERRAGPAAHLDRPCDQRAGRPYRHQRDHQQSRRPGPANVRRPGFYDKLQNARRDGGRRALGIIRPRSVSPNSCSRSARSRCCCWRSTRWSD